MTPPRCEVITSPGDGWRDCSRECGPDGTSCRLHFDQLLKVSNMRILERRGGLAAVAFGQEELTRLREKRGFMERLGVSDVREIACKHPGEGLS